jgi:hypothetical protein
MPWGSISGVVGLHRDASTVRMPATTLSEPFGFSIESSLGGLPPNTFNTTFSDGCLGSNNDEGRSEV